MSGPAMVPAGPYGTPAVPPIPPQLLHHRRSALTWVTMIVLGLGALAIAVLIVLSAPDVLSKFSYFTSRPSDALQASWDLISAAYADLFKGAVFDPATVSAWLGGSGSWQEALNPISETLTYAAPLVFTGLSVALAFRASPGRAVR